MTTVEVSGIMDNSKELDRLRKEQEEVLQEINKIHKKLQSNFYCKFDFLGEVVGENDLGHGLRFGKREEIYQQEDILMTYTIYDVFNSGWPEAPEMVEKSGDNVLVKLRALYIQAKELSENEVSVSVALIAQLDGLLQSGPSAAQRKKIEVTEQKKKRMKSDSDISRHSPAPSMRSQLELAASLKGEQVAARVTPDDAEKDEWFVVKVIHFDREAKEFEVFDEEPGDDEDGGGQRTYKLPMSRIIPFPKKNDPSSAPEYPTGKHVLAVYPGTTALYKATVVNPHRKLDILYADLFLFSRHTAINYWPTLQRKTDDYLLEFDDDEEDGSMPQRNVPFHKVVPLPEGHRQ
ncbi:hypothetical protein Sjap_016265 [Stephania japonica]|uniref:SGF29 C-terminal domain-containing protein n=1 Tax=Stephania japonica TaxID=461633 RepID=A0AAP0ILW4_9MAGN